MSAFGTVPTNEAQQSKIKVLIVGAGICGLMTAIQLERAGIEYEVFEKSKTCVPLGSALSLTASCSYIFEQLGMLDEIREISLPLEKIDYFQEDLSLIGVMGANNQKERYGYNGIMFSRPAFHNYLLSKVPAEKVHFGKRVLSLEQNQNGVMIRIADGTTYHGDILIGAGKAKTIVFISDGAYSAVRQALYKSMIKKGIDIPKSDMAPLHFDSNCVVGITEVQSEEDYPCLKEKGGSFHCVVGKERSIQVYVFMFSDNRMGWMICGKMENPEDHDEINFKFSDWGPVAADELCEQVRHFKIPFGGTVGDLMDRTSKERISKVMLEDKYFHTWWHLRTVLMGDACHKHLPFGGQGANQAILDSVHLVNQLYGIPSNSVEDIAKSFQAYYNYRSTNARKVFSSTGMVANILNNRGFGSDFMRSLVLSKMPDWMNNIAIDGMNTDRPVLCFLPAPNVQAKIKPNPQAIPVHYRKPVDAEEATTI
ncbi:hypothetical protein BGX27_004338 [Mortierella sp. AM989]|nr:hypothetical protein BGX27_004338 [Mortierella sp. AM989]